MTEKPKKSIPLLFDKRVLARNVATGKVSSKEVEEHLENLVDMQDNCEDIADQIYGEDTSKS